MNLDAALKHELVRLVLNRRWILGKRKHLSYYWWCFCCCCCCCCFYSFCFCLSFFLSFFGEIQSTFIEKHQSESIHKLNHINGLFFLSSLDIGKKSPANNNNLCKYCVIHILIRIRQFLWMNEEFGAKMFWHHEFLEWIQML